MTSSVSLINGHIDEPTMQKECNDCKYNKTGQCTRSHYMSCKHCDLWTPKDVKDRVDRERRIQDDLRKVRNNDR